MTAYCPVLNALSLWPEVLSVSRVGVADRTAPFRTPIVVVKRDDSKERYVVLR